jgi:hypothetical protein
MASLGHNGLSGSQRSVRVTMVGQGPNCLSGTQRSVRVSQGLNDLSGS